MNLSFFGQSARLQPGDSRLLGLVFCILIMSFACAAQETPEDIAYKAAARAFQDGLFDRAEREFGDWAKRYPKSEKWPEVVLLQAQARCKLNQYEGAVSLLSTHYAQAGKQADKYRLWIAEAQLQRGDNASAAAAYAQLLKDFSDSPARSQASFGEAYAWFKMGNVTNAMELLRQPGGAFQKNAQAQPNDEFVLRGHLLLADAYLTRQEYKSAEDTLNLLQNRPLPPQLNWRREFLLVRTRLENNRPAEALASLTNLLALATATDSPVSQADSIVLQGLVLDAAGQRGEAIKIYEQKFDSLPTIQKRQVLRKLEDLYLVSGNLAMAAQTLETFLARFPKDPEEDQIRLALGELYLKAWMIQKTAPGAITNALQRAQAQFDFLVQNSPQSPSFGMAQLNRGWCLLEVGNPAESAAAFKSATERIPASTNQLVARVKWADTQFTLKDYAGARDNYRLVASQAAQYPGLAPGWFENNHYQIIRACLELGDLPAATAALDKMIELYPQGNSLDRAMLLTGQALLAHNNPSQARKILSDIAQRLPKSPLIPEAQLTVARTWVQESNWAEAESNLDAWVTAYTNHPAVAQAEFDRAWIYQQAGQDAKALQLYTNFVARNPISALAPLAQNAAADYYFNLGKYEDAEKNYQLLFQNTNWAGSGLALRARFCAGRSAFNRQGFTDATNYFVTLINLLNNNPGQSQNLLCSTYFALGDTFIAMPGLENTNSLKKFGEAIVVFSRIPETNSLAPVAWGRIADCHFQLAAQDASRYTNALQFYQKVMDSPASPLSERSNAECGIAGVLEAQARSMAPPEQLPLLKQALDHYLNIALEKNLRPGEHTDPFWLGRAGLEAARMLEFQNQWTEAANLYQRLQKDLPNLRGILEKKADQARRKV
jgi:TolA-binding protein